ncbi:MAG: RNA methyltransferase [Chloroflexi bacterium]|nr:RNA methyltransferase [Chloroflexota bacterium]MCL5275708.1 RNA methyltransferase [Chloroflexota bacterium]
MPITSRSNPTVKHIRSLRERKERDRAGAFFIEGVRLVVEAAQLGADIQTLIVAPELLKSPIALETIEQQRRRGVSVLEVLPDVFDAISYKEVPQGIGAVVRQCWEPLDAVQPGDELCWVALDEPQDPGNIGTILRTSDATGCAGLILLDHSADPYDPPALRASMGAVFSQRLVRAGFGDLLAWKQAHGCAMVGASDRGQVEYRAAAYRFPLVLLMGSEREGLSAQQQAACDLVVRIPMAGRSDSLNLAVATGVMLYELYARRHG